MVDQHPDKVRAEYSIGEMGGFPMEMEGKRIYLIQVAQKGACWLRIKTQGDPGQGSSVKLATDGGTPLLIVGMGRPERIWAVNRTTHAVYWRGFQDDAHQPLSMAVGA